MRKEWESGLREIFYPHVTQNMEDKGIDTNISQPPLTKKQQEKQKEKEQSELQEDLEIAPYTMENHPKYLDKYPKHAIEIWVTTFNEVLKKTGDESKAFPIAWNALKRYMKKLKAEEIK